MAPSEDIGPLVTIEWLHEHLTAPGLVVIDVRSNPGEPDEGRDRFLEEHIPGARYLNVDLDLSAPAERHGGRRPLPDLATVGEKLRLVGIGMESTIVVYDVATGSAAARAWWLLEYLGLSGVKVLNGGYTAWTAASNPTATGPEPPVVPGNFDPMPQLDRVVGLERVLEMSKRRPAGLLVVDARKPAAFAGNADSGSGHIPSAINLPASELLDASGRMQGPTELRQRLAPLSEAQAVVAYCGSGMSACSLLLAMSAAHLDTGLLYPGGWSDWRSYPDMPIARRSE